MTDSNQTSPIYYIKKYSKLFLRRKWFILIAIPILAALIFIIAMKLSPRPEYTTSAILQFQDKRELAGERGGLENESKIALLLSRNFLQPVIEKLSLQLMLYTSDRKEVFDSLHISPNYEVGDYTLSKDEKNKRIQLFYSNQDQNIKNEVVSEIDLSENTIFYKGLEIFLKSTAWEKNNKIVFGLNYINPTIDYLRENLKTDFVQRSKSLLKVSLKGKDAGLITETLTTIVEEFIGQNINVKKYQTREILNILSEQLEAAKADLDKKADELKRFRQSNPLIGAAGATALVTEMNTDEVNRNELIQKKDELEKLMAGFSNTGGEEKYPIINEILSFLNAQRLPTLPAISSEFLNLTSERTRLLNNYSESHPFVLENSEKLNKNVEKVIITAENQISNWQNEIGNFENQIQSQAFKIRSLPAKEQQFAELQRERDVAGNIYSNLLVRYNQAKVADAVEVGDIVVIDSPVLPRKISRSALIMKYIIISLVFSIFLSFGTVIALDFFDKTVRDVNDIAKSFEIPVVAKIPIVGSVKETPNSIFDSNKRIDPKLVTTDYSPTPVGEAYRSLRTQLLFGEKQKAKRSFFITSLNPGDGKSLNAGNLAITFAQQKIPTLLVDADLRRGVLHNSFACKKKPGLSDFLYSNSEINDENIRKVIQQTHIPNLYLFSSGMPVPNPSEILGSQRGKDVIKFLIERFGFVVVDTPPIVVTSDSVVISQFVDSGLFVIRAGKTNIDDVKARIAEYKNFNTKLFGFILNCAELDLKKDNYKYSYYNY